MRAPAARQRCYGCPTEDCIVETFSLQYLSRHHQTSSHRLSTLFKPSPRPDITLCQCWTSLGATSANAPNTFVSHMHATRPPLCTMFSLQRVNAASLPRLEILSRGRETIYHPWLAKVLLVASISLFLNSIHFARTTWRCPPKRQADGRLRRISRETACIICHAVDSLFGRSASSTLDNKRWPWVDLRGFVGAVAPLRLQR